MTENGSRGCSGDFVSEKLSIARVSHPLADPLARLQQALAEAPVQALPAFIGELEKLKAQAWSRLARPSMDNRGQSIPVSDKSGSTPKSASTPVDHASDMEYLSIHDLANRIGYAEGTIRNLMSDGVFKLGEHYVKPRGRIFFKWPAVRIWLEATGTQG